MSEKVILAFNWRICIYYIYKYNMEILNKNNVYKPNWSELHSFGFVELLSRFHRSKKQKPFPWYSLPFSVPTRTLPAGSQFDGISCSGGFGESGGFPSDLDQTLTIEGCHINSIPMFWNDVLTAYIDIYIYICGSVLVYSQAMDPPRRQWKLRSPNDGLAETSPRESEALGSSFNR